MSKYDMTIIPFPVPLSYKLVKLLGQGTSAKVYLGIHKQSLKYAAIKAIPIQTSHSDHSNRLLEEIKILKRLDHFYCVRLLHFEVCFLYI